VIIILHACKTVMTALYRFVKICRDAKLIPEGASAVSKNGHQMSVTDAGVTALNMRGNHLGLMLILCRSYISKGKEIR
jgi:hypothetical protein